LPERVPKWWSYQAEFPDWRVWRGEDQRYYARLPRTNPLVIVHGEDPADLRERIAHEITKLRITANGPPSSWHRQALAAWYGGDVSRRAPGRHLWQGPPRRAVAWRPALVRGGCGRPDAARKRLVTAWIPYAWRPRQATCGRRRRGCARRARRLIRLGGRPPGPHAARPGGARSTPCSRRSRPAR
jgi:hypothetical protein